MRTTNFLFFETRYHAPLPLHPVPSYITLTRMSLDYVKKKEIQVRNTNRPRLPPLYLLDDNQEQLHVLR